MHANSPSRSAVAPLAASGPIDSERSTKARASVEDEERVQMEVGGDEPAVSITTPTTGSAIATLTAGTAGTFQVPPQQPQQLQLQRRENWFSRWRWVLAAVAVIVLGRISSF